MVYARIDNGKVAELIPAFDPVFPGIPVEQRFHKSIVAQLVEVPEGLNVGQHWLYTEENEFEAPPEVSETDGEVTT